MFILGWSLVSLTVLVTLATLALAAWRVLENSAQALLHLGVQEIVPGVLEHKVLNKAQKKKTCGLLQNRTLLTGLYAFKPLFLFCFEVVLKFVFLLFFFNEGKQQTTNNTLPSYFYIISSFYLFPSMDTSYFHVCAISC